MAETILVTGATGAIGRMVVPALLEAGFAVRGQYARARDLPSHDGLEWVRADFAASLAADDLVRHCAGVLHLAGEVADPALMQRMNVDAAEALAGAAARAGVRYFGLASSMVVYGSPRTRLIDEATPTIDLARPLQGQFHEPPTTLEYARTKLRGEQVVRAAAGGMAVDLYRIAKSAAPERMLEALDWSPAQRAMRLYGYTHYIDRRDCAAAIVYLARLGLQRAGGVEIYNIADDAGGTYADLLRRFGGGRAPHLPLLLEMAKNALKYRSLSLRWPAGFARMSAAKLRATGFRYPVGYDAALAEAIAERQEPDDLNSTAHPE